MKNLQKIEVMEIGSKWVNLNQETFVDGGTGYEIFVAKDLSWVAEDDALGEWVQIKEGNGMKITGEQEALEMLTRYYQDCADNVSYYGVINDACEDMLAKLDDELDESLAEIGLDENTITRLSKIAKKTVEEEENEK